MPWNSSNWYGSNWNKSYWWLGGSLTGGVLISAEVSLASAITHNTQGQGSFILLGGPAIASGTTFLPYPKIITVPNTISVTGSVNAPTLSIGSTIFVGTSIASARVLRPTFGTISLNENYNGLDIIDVDPGITKGILKIDNDQFGIVLVGITGISTGDKIIHLGNGQWKRL